MFFQCSDFNPALFLRSAPGFFLPGLNPGHLQSDPQPWLQKGEKRVEAARILWNFFENHPAIL